MSGHRGDPALDPVLLAAPQPVLLIDPAAGTIIDLNAAAAELLVGRPRGELVHSSWRGSGLVAEDSTLDRLLRDAVAGKPVHNVLVRRSGTDSVLVTLVRTDENGTVAMFTLPEPQDAEAFERLKRRERQLTAAEGLAHIGSWMWDIKADKITWSDELYRIYGLTPQSFPASYEAYVERLHPEDRDHANAVVAQAMADHQPFEFEHRIVRPSGEERFLLGRGRVIVKDGAPALMYGTALDITESHAAFEALRRQSVTRALVRRLLRGFGATEALRRELGLKLALEVGSTELTDHVAAFRSMGLGDVELVSRTADRFTFKGADLIELEAGAREPTCFMALAFLEGTVGAVLNAPALGVEWTCESRGDAACEFVIKPRARTTRYGFKGN